MIHAMASRLASVSTDGLVRKRWGLRAGWALAFGTPYSKQRSAVEANNFAGPMALLLTVARLGLAVLLLLLLWRKQPV